MATSSKRGRPKGSRNKSTVERYKAVTEGISPLEFLLERMRKPVPADAPALVQVELHAQKFEAAKAAAPYVHPKLTSVEVGGKEDGKPIQVVVSKADAGLL